MTAKKRDRCNRWRSRTVAFRMSPEEDDQLEVLVRLSGLTKQDYIISRLLLRDVVVQGNPKVFKALRGEMAEVLAELRRIEGGDEISEELHETIRMIARIMKGMSREEGHGR